MKVCILYWPESERARSVDEFVHEFARVYPDEPVELIGLGTQKGASMAALYQLMDFPAILVLDGDGKVQQLWQGETLPLMSEVAGYAHA